MPAQRLCSRTNSVCMAVSPTCSFARTSPARNSEGSGPPAFGNPLTLNGSRFPGLVLSRPVPSSVRSSRARGSSDPYTFEASMNAVISFNARARCCASSFRERGTPTSSARRSRAASSRDCAPRRTTSARRSDRAEARRWCSARRASSSRRAAPASWGSSSRTHRQSSLRLRSGGICSRRATGTGRGSRSPCVRASRGSIPTSPR